MDYQLLSTVKAFAFDVDGVFTNSEVLVTENGELLRTMNTRDGQAIKIALNAGFLIGIMTKGTSAGVRKRFEVLGISDIYDKLDSKEEAMESFINQHQIDKKEILYMGDDIPDLALYDMVGISVAPHDAAVENLRKAMWVTSKEGGKGCVREVIERTMRVQGKWNFE